MRVLTLNHKTAKLHVVKGTNNIDVNYLPTGIYQIKLLDNQHQVIKTEKLNVVK